MRVFFMTALVLGISFAGTVSAQQTATEFVQQRAEAVISVVNSAADDAEPEARRSALRAAVGSFVDFEVLAERALGEHWDARTAEERAEFVALLRELVETSYTSRLGDERIDPDAYSVVYGEERSRRGRTTVEATLTFESRTHVVEVKVLDREEGRAVYDVVTDDVSLQESYAESFDQIIRTHGWGELLTRIRARIDELKA